jgi:hypothetical protein
MAFPLRWDVYSGRPMGQLNLRGIFGGDSEREVWGNESISVRLPDYLFEMRATS